MRRLLGFVSLLALAVAVIAPARMVLARGNASAPVHSHPVVTTAVKHDTSPPLSSLVGSTSGSTRQSHPLHSLPSVPRGSSNILTTPPQVQVGTNVPTTSNNFDGVGSGFTGPQGTFTVSSAPPDTNGAVGPQDYVQIVNTDFAVFNKDTTRGAVGTVRYGPVQINTLWSGFGGLCQADNDGDPGVVYDQIANRWIISQFAVTNPNPNYYQCVAVSTTGDPTGTYYRYSFSYSNFPDYPKFGLWPDGYYATFNMFSSTNTFLGGQVCAYDRTSMLTGAAATQQCFSAGSNYGGLLPSTLDGTRLPPTGSPDYILALDTTTSLAFWKFHVDWTTPANSTFTGPTSVPVASYAQGCSGGTCIPQTGTTNQLDSLADRLMYRLQYRNFGTYESLVVDHTITAGSSTGMRWYEIRSPATTPTLYQQGTYAPDANYRWMGSIAQDQSGDMAMGFSISSSTTHPGVHYTGRLISDPLGQMPQGEASIIDGAGSQTGTLTRWGDYSSMMVDPSDNCTFWYTNEYIPSNGSFNWKTRIGSFKFPSCSSTTTNDFSISSSPATLSIQQGSSGTSTISTAVTTGVAGTVNLTASVSPAGPTATLSPTSVTAGSSSTLTVNVGTSVATGSYTVTVTGVEGTATHTATVTVTVTAPVTNDFSISSSPTTLSIQQGSSGTSTISTAVTTGVAGTVNLTASVSPTGPTATLSPTSVTAGGSSTLTVNVGTSVATGSYTVTVTGVEGTATHTATVTVTVTAPVTNDFTISSSPTTLSIQQGSSGTSTISTAVKSGSAGTVNLTASVSPTGPTATLSPTSVTAGGSSTLTVNVGSSVATGSYTVTVTGTEGTATHTATVTVTVTAPATGGVVNGGFETGTLSGWTSAGAATSISKASHSGTYAAQAGSTSPTNGDSSISQTFTIPSGDGTLSFWYKVVCPDTVTYDWATATLKDNTTGTTSTMLAKTCNNSGTWVQVSTGVTAGHSVTLTLISHDDNYTGDPTYTLYDDVALAAAVTNPVVNGGFETGTLSGWTSAGAATSVSTTSHSGTYAARAGSTSPTNGDSSISQTITVPTGASTVSFWYQVVCPDTVTYDWATVTLKDNTTGTTKTVLAKTCNNNGTWVQVSAGVTAGHSVTLTLISHDDNYTGDPTYTLYDDVVIR